jgi:hypothetical protein
MNERDTCTPTRGVVMTNNSLRFKFDGLPSKITDLGDERFLIEKEQLVNEILEIFDEVNDYLSSPDCSDEDAEDILKRVEKFEALLWKELLGPRRKSAKRSKTRSR